MKYQEIIKITPALDGLRKLNLPYSKARAIHRMYKEFESEFIFFAQEETKLVKRFAVKDENGEPIISESGIVTFADVESKKAYTAEIIKLNSLDAEITVTPVTLAPAEIGEQCISPDAIDKLDGVIIFE